MAEEARLRPLDWLHMLSFVYPPPAEMLQRHVMVPDRAMTKLEYLDEMAKAKERMTHGKM